MKNLTFITGGARSGKSDTACQLATAFGMPVYYLATMKANSDDSEQVARIARHQLNRPADWQTIECGCRLSETLKDLPASPAVVLLDCLSLYVSGLLTLDGRGDEPYALCAHVDAQISQLLQTIETRSELTVIAVSNEVGSGVVPETSLGRAFRDMLGQANQRFAASADDTILCVSGIPLDLKRSGKLVSHTASRLNRPGP